MEPENNKYPRLIIGAAASGAGKTLFTSLLGRLFSQKGFAVQPFKTGPDYIDPSYHSIACGRPCRNLDSCLVNENTLLELFSRSARDADLSLVEGVMGLFDGAGGLDERGSTAHTAKILNGPVILLLDVSAMARSAGAVALGYRDFDPQVKISGFILNKTASPRHLESVRAAIEDRTGLPVLGSVPRSSGLVLPERHLGLVPAWESREFRDFLDKNTELLNRSIDIDRLVDITRKISPLPDFSPEIFSCRQKDPSAAPRIAYAFDKAFHFYYQDNLDILEQKGADLVPFSPLKDRELPKDTGGLYIGGGYPELFARELEENSDMRTAVRLAADEGMPVWGECGGMMYLMDKLTDMEGRAWDMAGVFPGKTVMKKGLRALGYYNAGLQRETWFGKPGDQLTGHVFHWSETRELKGEFGPIFRLEKESDSPEVFITDGLYRKNCWAGYLHIHFGSNLNLVDSFIDICRKHINRPTRIKQ